MDKCPTYFGKYRGHVTNPIDPQGLGRVQVSVDDVLGDGILAWAMPCSPFAGPGVGFFAIPPSEAQVWVEFERGDPDYPIWSGGFWGPLEAPVLGPQQLLTRVLAGHNFRLEVLDIPAAGMLTLALKLATGEAKIEVDVTGMTLTWGLSTVKLSLDGVSINGSNLKVLP